jgi:glycosyltransferase involved in cell wall biosynthesis
LHRRYAAIWVQADAFRDSLRRAYLTARAPRAWEAIASRIAVFGNGIDAPPPAGEAMPERRFLFIGRLVEQKDLPTLLAALREVVGADLCIAGSGPLRPALEREAADLPVRFLGEVEHARVPELMRGCRALVLCSTHEGVPNVVLEALAHGRPVIATPVGAIPELVRDHHNGRIVPVGDPEALAQALRDLCDDATWQRLADATRASVAAFAWPALVDRVEAELVRLAATR